MIYIVLAVVAVILLVFFNPTANRIRKINKLINKDRSVCDFIIELEGWDVTPIAPIGMGLRMVITNSQLIKELYITYKDRYPANDEIKYLYKELTKEDSVVTKAHKANMPVDKYIQRCGF